MCLPRGAGIILERSLAVCIRRKRGQSVHCPKDQLKIALVPRTKGAMVYHAANLSRGVLCPCFANRPADLFLRIQSTACEQKRWGQVLLSLGSHVLCLLANGCTVIVHDLSEKPRTTRALWQGVPWIRYALQRAWCLPPTPVVSRNGMIVTEYAERCWRELSGSTKNELKYFRKMNPSAVNIFGCQEV